MPRGRPTLAPERRRQQIGVRTSSRLKVLLEQAAAVNGRSVAQEAEWRLERSFVDADLDQRVRQLESQMRAVVMFK